MEQLIGWAANFPRYGFTRKGVEVCAFKLAVSQPYGKVIYFEVAAGGRGAEICAQRLAKGMFLAVDGYFWQRPSAKSNKYIHNDRVLIAEQIHQLADSKGGFITGLYYKDVLPPAEGYYTVGDGPFDQEYQTEIAFLAFAAGGR